MTRAPQSSDRRGRILALLAVMSLLPAGTALAQMQVVSVSPVNAARAAANTTISVTFDRAVDTTTITSSTFRAFGRGSGRAVGAFGFSNGDKTVTLTPSEPFSAGETVWVNLAHTIKGADTVALRSAGYAFEFWVQTQPTAANFRAVDVMSNRSPSNAQTRIYGALASDFNGDRYLDLATVNEVSADLRVFLNLGDGSGHFGAFLTPVAIGDESSPNEPADFNNDGKIDAVVSATEDDAQWILLGNGNGGFAADPQRIPVHTYPHGVAVLDVDGDGDLDVVNCNDGGDDISVMRNNGSGVFGAPAYYDTGTVGEYGLVAGDFNNDGITDLVVGANTSQEIITMLGNGTFTPSTPQDSGGSTWVVAGGDVDDDGNLDVAVANDGTGNVTVLLGNGDGTFDPPTFINDGPHIPSVELGDLDGDGDLDLVFSSFGGGYWKLYSNDGSGNFSFHVQIDAPSNPSCSILYDADNDGDLDLALSDEIADVVLLMENAPPTLCSPAPQTCRSPTLIRKSVLAVKNAERDKSDRLAWKWRRGQATTKMDYGSPLTTEDYELCLYDGSDTLFYSAAVPAGDVCPTLPCWKDRTSGYLYKDRVRDPGGVRTLKLKAGVEGKASITLSGSGPRLDLMTFADLSGTIKVQLQKSGGGSCWGANFSAPFELQTDTKFRARSDAP